MKQSLHAAFAAAMLMGSAGAAFAGEPAKAPDSQKSCFYASSVSGWERVDGKTVRVTVGPSKRYDLTLISAPSTDLLQENIGLKSSPSNLVCTGNGLGVSVVTGGFGLRDIPVEKVALAPTRAEEKAMKAREKAAAGKPT